MSHAVVALCFALTACTTPRPTAPVPVVDTKTVAAQLASFLPEHLGPFAAIRGAEVSASTPARVELERPYRDAAGRTLSIRLVTGDLAYELMALDTDEEHAFGSDTPTYWKTTTVRDLRTRIAENRVKREGSTAYVRVSTRHVAVVQVDPAISDGESATWAGRLDLEGIARTSGLPAPAVAPR